MCPTPRSVYMRVSMCVYVHLHRQRRREVYIQGSDPTSCVYVRVHVCTCTHTHRQSRREVFIKGSDPIHGHQPTRQELGFAEDDVILCSFNQLYKIEPNVFAAWMRVLKKVCGNI